jgi:hypothetical protein
MRNPDLERAAEAVDGLDEVAVLDGLGPLVEELLRAV